MKYDFLTSNRVAMYPTGQPLPEDSLGIEAKNRVGNLDAPWDYATDMNVQFFDCISMHSLSELYAISEMLIRHNPKVIVEYGTATGGLSALFGKWAFLSGAKVLTIDNECYSSMKHFPRHRKILELFGVEIYFGDEYQQSTYEKVQEFAEGKKTFFYCDGGNKPLEFRICAQILKPGDLLVSHDYEMELESGMSSLPPLLLEVAHVTKKQADRTIKEFGLEKMFEAYLGEDENGNRKTRLLAVRLKAEAEPPKE